MYSCWKKINLQCFRSSDINLVNFFLEWTLLPHFRRHHFSVDESLKWASNRSLLFQRIIGTSTIPLCRREFYVCSAITAIRASQLAGVCFTVHNSVEDWLHRVHTRAQVHTTEGQLFCRALYVKPPTAKVTKQASQPPSRPVIRFDKSPIIIDEFLIGAKHEFNWVRLCESERGDRLARRRPDGKANINSRALQEEPFSAQNFVAKLPMNEGLAHQRSTLILIDFCSLKTNINKFMLPLSLSLFNCDQTAERRSLGIEIWLKVLRRWRRQPQSRSPFCLHHAQRQRAGAACRAGGWPTNRNPNYCCIWQLFLTQKSDRWFVQISSAELMWLWYQIELIYFNCCYCQINTSLTRGDGKRGWKT